MEQQAHISDEKGQLDAPFGLEAWVNYLQNKPFPVRASSLKRLRLLVQSDTTMISHLTALIKSDPILSLVFVRAAQQAHNQAQRDSSVASIEHAVSSLGMDPIESLSRSLKPAKVNPNSIQQQQYFRAIANSHLAAYQTQTWMLKKNLPFVDENYLASLFYSVGLWSLWLNAPLHMHQINVLIHEKNSDPAQAELSILGCSMQEISHGLSKVWGFSELICQAQDPETSPSRALMKKLRDRSHNPDELSDDDNRAINHMIQDRTFPIKLANWYAMNVSREWKGNRTGETTETICSFLGGDEDTTRAVLNQVNAAASHHYHVNGTLAPAAEMLMIPINGQTGNYKLTAREIALLTPTAPAVQRPVVKKPSPVAAPVKKPVTESKAAEPSYRAHPTSADELLDQNKYKAISDRFRDGYHLYTKPSHILGGLIQGLSQGLGLQRITLSLVNTKAQTLKAAQAIGLDKDDPLANYEIDLRTQGLFNKICAKPTCVWIKDSNRTQYETIMSQSSVELLPKQDILIMSIFKNDKPIAVIYADGGNNPMPLTAFQHERFKQLCASASKALSVL